MFRLAFYLFLSLLLRLLLSFCYFTCALFSFWNERNCVSLLLLSLQKVGVISLKDLVHRAPLVVDATSRLSLVFLFSSANCWLFSVSRLSTVASYLGRIDCVGLSMKRATTRDQLLLEQTQVYPAMATSIERLNLARLLVKESPVTLFPVTCICVHVVMNGVSQDIK